MNLFRGREDVYPLRWESSKGKTGYSPICANEWERDICQKFKVKCGNCEQRLLLPVTERIIFDHLTGKHSIGVYSLLPDNMCYFLAMDFDEADWREDVSALMQSCRDFSIPAAVEVSRSGNGAHMAVEAKRGCTTPIYRPIQSGCLAGLNFLRGYLPNVVNIVWMRMVLLRCITFVK